MREKNDEDLDEIEVCGYPSDKNPHTMWYASGSCRNSSSRFFFYRIPTRQGQSGSPIIKKKGRRYYTMGVHIGQKNSSKSNVAIRLTP